MRGLGPRFDASSRPVFGYPCAERNQPRRWTISRDGLVGVVSTIVALSVMFVSRLDNPTRLVRLPLVLPIPLVLAILVFSLLMIAPPVL